MGVLCTRCQTTILPGQPVEPDHLDGGGPNDYAGWAHASCNHSAGASRGNRLRAQAYRALRGAIMATPAPNGAAVVVREPPPERPTCRRTREEIKAAADWLPCLGCGRHVSRCW